MNETKKTLFLFSFGLLLLNTPANGMEELLLPKNGAENSKQKIRHGCFSSMLESTKENVSELFAHVKQEIWCCLQPEETDTQANYHTLSNNIPK